MSSSYRSGTPGNEAASAPVRPRPTPTLRTKGFWDAARRGELAIQRCSACQRFFHPPAPICMRCHGEDLGFERVSGEGTIHSFSIMRGSPPPGFESATPYAVLAVELDEQPGLVVMGNLVGVPPEFAQVGRRVRVVFQTLDDSFVLPMFEFIADESGKV